MSCFLRVVADPHRLVQMTGFRRQPLWREDKMEETDTVIAVFADHLAAEAAVKS